MLEVQLPRLVGVLRMVRLSSSFLQRSCKTATLDVAEDRLILHAHPNMYVLCDSPWPWHACSSPVCRYHLALKMDYPVNNSDIGAQFNKCVLHILDAHSLCAGRRACCASRVRCWRNSPVLLCAVVSISSSAATWPRFSSHCSY